MQDSLIDIHAHILPGIDDGARNIEESIEMAAMAVSQGIKTIIATPHYYRRGNRKDYRKIYEETKRQIQKAIPELSLFLGQELYYHEELEDRLLSGQALTLSGTRYVLVEFDTRISYSQMSRAVRSLAGFGYIPVLAHIERYECLREEGALSKLHRLGAMFQMNYESLTGRWYEADIRWCRKQIKEKNIHFLGTDMHRKDYRPPEIKKAIAWLERHTDAAYAAEITRKNAMDILKDY